MARARRKTRHGVHSAAPRVDTVTGFVGFGGVNRPIPNGQRDRERLPDVASQIRATARKRRDVCLDDVLDVCHANRGEAAAAPRGDDDEDDDDDACGD